MIDVAGAGLKPARGFFSSLWLILKCINGKLHSDAWKIHKQVCFRKLLTEKTKRKKTTHVIFRHFFELSRNAMSVGAGFKPACCMEINLIFRF